METKFFYAGVRQPKWDLEQFWREENLSFGADYGKDAFILAEQNEGIHQKSVMSVVPLLLVPFISCHSVDLVAHWVPLVRTTGLVP